MRALALIFVGGALYAAAGLTRSLLKGERFNLRKLLATILLAGLLAVLNASLGLDAFSDLDLVIQGAGETVLLDKLAKVVRVLVWRLRSGEWLG
ncbi:MAG: hypothetical protein J7L17_00040 [Thaumarchaeota archaeon]|nr:hypothetical protein [Nitrososphaerota archaeon]